MQIIYKINFLQEKEKRIMKEKMNNKGFSLVELIIVIAIMAILVGVLAPQFIKYVERSRVSTDMQNVESYKNAIEAYIADTGSVANCQITVTGGASGTVAIPAAIVGTGMVEGVSASTALRSQNWSGTVTYSYTAATGWSTGSVTNPAGSYDMQTIFQ